MGIIVDFFRWLYRLLKSCVANVTGLWGVVTAVVLGVGEFVTTFFGSFSWVSDIVGWLDEAPVDDLVNSLGGPVSEVLLHFLALDQLLASVTALCLLTVGLVSLVISTFFLGVLSLVPTCLAVRSVLKAVQTFSGGLVNP